MEKLEQVLKQLGFSDNERTVYRGLLEFGPQSITDLARKIGLYRPDVYQALGRLTAKRLVTTAPRGKRKVYVAAPPRALRTLLGDLLSGFDDALPAIEEEVRFVPEKPTLHVLEGKKGLTAAFADVIDTLKKGETFYRITSERDLAHANSYLPRDYRERRDKKELERFVIMRPDIGVQKKSRMERAAKYLPADANLTSDVIELVYAHKVAFLDLNTETALIIESAPLADFHKKLFQLLYRKL